MSTLGRNRTRTNKLEATTGIVPQTGDAIDFLEALHPGGPWHLVAIKDGVIKGQTYDQVDPMKRRIDELQGAFNIYVHVNELGSVPPKGKATKADVILARYLHVDVDDPRGETLERLRAFRPPPTVITNSGGGYQAFWKLVEPSSELNQVEDCNKRLAKQLGGDNCHNIDRIMRVPGTINVLSKKKIERGRIPALAYVEEVDWSRAYSLGDFPTNGKISDSLTVAALPDDVPKISIDNLPPAIDEFTKTLLREGDDPSAPRESSKPHFKSRSETVWRVVHELVRAGCDDITIAGAILNPALKISASILDKPNPKKYAFKQITSARAAVESDFPDISKDGRLRPSLPNTKVALIRMDVTSRYDEFKQRYTINGYQLENYVGEVSDPALLRLRELVHENFGFDPPTETVLTAVQTLANHSRFHPVRDYLDGLRWDGVERLDTWLIDYGGAEDKPFTRAIGAVLLVAAVRRVRRPGSKFDELVIFESGQGTNKSQALRVLAVEPEWFSDDLPLGLSARETIEVLSGHWIVEASELQGIRKSEIEKIKAFLSRDTDRARTAYARTVTEARRQCVVVGTTNSEQYLRDLTGNRRFWPVRIECFDLVKLELDRDQLWAEAAQREMKGASIRLPEELWPAAEIEQLERVAENPFTSVLEHVLREKDVMINGVWVEGPPLEGKLTSEDAWTAVGLRVAQRSQQNMELLGHAMKQLGWTRKRLRVGQSGRSYMYVKGPEPYRRIAVYADDSGGPAWASYEKEPKPNY